MRNANEEMTNDILALRAQISEQLFIYNFKHFSLLISHFSFGISFIVR